MADGEGPHQMIVVSGQSGSGDERRVTCGVLLSSSWVGVLGEACRVSPTAEKKVQTSRTFAVIAKCT